MPTTQAPSDSRSNRRKILPFANGRSAFKSLLRAIAPAADERILLPSYIGWTPREGSGVFDPIRELGLAHGFYRMDERLEIDLDDLRRCLAAGRTKLLVLIHYFGRVDPRCAEAVALARQVGALVLEDEAHAMLTDLVAGSCGRLGDACILSLHKLLPVPSGGALVLNPTLESLVAEGSSVAWEHSPWEYDLAEIARRRVANAIALSRLLPESCSAVQPLWPELPAGAVPQSWPVLVRQVSRDRLHERLLACGVGALSLYYRLIPEIDPDAHAASHELSRRILNLPIHQDVQPAELEGMVERLSSCIALP